MRSLEAIRVHVRLLLPHIGHLPHQVHDATRAFLRRAARAGASATTINRSLEVVRAIFTEPRVRTAMTTDPVAEAIPPLITMLPESRRLPYPITWDEQDRLFPRLPAHLQRMVLFAVNTGLRDSNVCGLVWNWEVFVPEIGRSVFVVPAHAFKPRRPHVVVLNDAAWSIIQAQRGGHPVWVFPYRGRQVATMNNNCWQPARRKSACNQCAFMICAIPTRVGCAPPEYLPRTARHYSAIYQSMAGHYASADVGAW